MSPHRVDQVLVTEITRCPCPIPPSSVPRARVHICRYGLLLVATALLSGCFASRPPAPKVVARTSSERMQELTVGEYLWMVRVVEGEKLFSNGQVDKSSESKLFLCTKDAELGPACRPARILGASVRPTSAARHDGGRTKERSPVQTPLATKRPASPAREPTPREQTACKKFVMSLEVTSRSAIKAALSGCYVLVTESDDDRFVHCVEKASTHQEAVDCQNHP